MARIFICYSRDDRQLADQLAELLRTAGQRVWYDHELKGGDEWWAEIVNQITNCDDFVFLMSETSIESEYCRRELSTACGMGKHIIPVKICGSVTLPEGESFLNDLQQVDVTGGITPQGICAVIGSLTRDTPELLQERREADLRLVSELWSYISSTKIGRLDNLLDIRCVDLPFWRTFGKYLFIRRNYPEKNFIDASLKTAFKAFDESLQDLVDFVGLNWFTRDIYGDGDQKLIPRHKMLEFDRERYNEEQWIEASKDYHRTMDRVIEVRQKRSSPEFPVKAAA
jgi:hypothetical protein